MARYQYAGPGPVPDPESGEVVRPGDVREFAEEPGWGPWELIEEEEHGATGTQAGLEADTQASAPASPAAASAPGPLSAPFAAPVTPQEM